MPLKIFSFHNWLENFTMQSLQIDIFLHRYILFASLDTGLVNKSSELRREGYQGRTERVMEFSPARGFFSSSTIIRNLSRADVRRDLYKPELAIITDDWKEKALIVEIKKRKVKLLDRGYCF